MFVKEGEAIEVGFRGNLQPDEDVDLTLIFNSHIKTQLNLYVAEIDKYAQKSFNSYRGFAQLFVKGALYHYICYNACAYTKYVHMYTRNKSTPFVDYH